MPEVSERPEKPTIDVLLALALFALTVGYLSTWPHNLGPSDESHFLYHTKLVYEGAVPYRDFFEFHTPLAYYVMALAFAIGEVDLASAKFTMALIHGAVVVLVFACGRELGASRSLAATGALAYGTLQWLDPDPEYRRSRVALCVAAIAIASLGPAPGATTSFGIVPLLLALLAVGLAGIRSFHVTHFRALPLALPFYCAGLALAGEPRAALAGLGVLTLGTLVGVAGHRFAPVQGNHV